MASKNIGIKEDVYERLKSHKRGDESFSETLDRLLEELDSDWRTHAGFLSEEDAADLETEVSRGLDDLDTALENAGKRVDDRLNEETS